MVSKAQAPPPPGAHTLLGSGGTEIERHGKFSKKTEVQDPVSGGASNTPGGMVSLDDGSPRFGELPACSGHLGCTVDWGWNSWIQKWCSFNSW